MDDDKDQTRSASARDESDAASRRRGRGRYAYGGLDRLIHERARLAILSSLAADSDGVTFNDLKSLCALTDGNLSRQLQLLRDAELIDIEKSAPGQRPRTTVRLTRTGRKKFLDYIAELERVVSDASEARRPAPGTIGRATPS